MVNRVLEQKRIKMRRRQRYARFSDAVVMNTIEDPKITAGKMLPIGEVSLSKQVIGLGLRVPGRAPNKYSLNREVMKAVNPKKDLVSKIPITLDLSIEREQALRLAHILADQDLRLNHRIRGNERSRFIYFCFYNSRLSDIFLVRINNKNNDVHRSINLPSIARAQHIAFEGTPIPEHRFWIKALAPPEQR